MADSAIKLPNRDVVNINVNLVSAEEITQALFDDLVAIELISLTRTDTVTGINQSYSIISDLSQQNIRFDPSLLLVNRGSYDTGLNQFPINLSSRVPDDKYYDSNTLGKPDYDLAPNVYYDGENIVIEFVDTVPTDIIQVQLMEDAKISIVRENDY